MTEDQKSSEDKLSRLKHKLKDMGVMQDEKVWPEKINKSFWRGKLPILLVLLFAIGFISWISRNDLTLNKLDEADKLDSNNDSDSVQASFYPPYKNYQVNRLYPPSPPVWYRAPLYNSNHRAYQSRQRMGFAARPGEHQFWNRRYGRNGPPRGWQAYLVYPPPPQFFTRYNHYGLSPGFYSNPGYRGYNSQSRRSIRPNYNVAK